MRRLLGIALLAVVSCGVTASSCASTLEGGSVAISIDDGPWSPGNRTGELLDVLREEGVVATFCLVGQMVNTTYGAAMVRRMRDEGHELCNHSYSHSILTQRNIVRQITQTDAAIGRAIGVEGYTTPVLRAPYGNTASLHDKRCYGGRPIVGWGDHGDSNDYRLGGAHVLQIASRLPHGEILLLHDMHEPPQRLREIIRRLKTRGMTFVHASVLWHRPCGGHLAATDHH